jgi:hypothetical protein
MLLSEEIIMNEYIVTELAIDEDITLSDNNLNIIYNLGNFKTGDIKITNNKSLLDKYIKMGYTLISTIWK